MGIDMGKGGRIGCAYYVAMDEVLYVEEDVAMGGIEAVDTLLLGVQPTTVLVPNRAPIELVELLERDAQRLDDESSSGERGAYVLRHLASAEFDYDTAKDGLASINLTSTPDPVEVVPSEEDAADCIGSSKHRNLMCLAEVVNLDSHLSIGCAGAVLNDINRRRTVEDSASDADAFPSFQITAIQMNTPADTMLVSADVLMSLQILRSEAHPNPQSQYSNNSESKAKESLSVYGLLQALACTSQGKAKLRQMLFRPSTNIDMIDERQRTIAVFLRPENREVVMAIRKLMRRVKNTKAVLRYVKRGVDRIRGQLSIRTGDWRALLRFSMVSSQLREALLALSGTSVLTIFPRIHDSIDPPVFLAIGEMILKTIDFQLSKESGHTEIMQGASERLDELKRVFARACEMLPDLTDGIQKENPAWAGQHIQHCTILPQLGFLVAVTIDQESGEGLYSGHTANDNWQISFANDGLVYYKNAALLELDSHFGDLPSQIADEEINVVMELSTAVLTHEDSIMRASDILGELDSLLALAWAAEKYGWIAPQMTCSNIIDIVDGRHPLQELLVPSFIPNNCIIAGGPGNDDLGEENASTEGNPAIFILTGPNNSGKSVYMKQVALIVYLAHIGSYVPATRATIGVTDRILTRIATRETVVDDESAFLVDLKQAAFTMNFASRRSLILADEFGKGTTTETGSALFASYLAHFLDLGEDRPKVLVGTHFHDIFDNNILQAGDGVAFGHMDVRLNPEAEDVEDQITFLHHLLLGRGLSSLGTLCAAINDIESDVVERARALIDLQELNEDLEEACSKVSEEDIQGLGPAELVARRFLETMIPTPGPGVNAAGSIRGMLEEVISLPQMEDTGL
ncbi:muts domain V-domain-containing protein [Lasiosphaeria hispida]|uniref:DNA mismatch repair protein MSH5 n=1 Tax=Lasiosphaeria hispida TaxID=260671 RepID=A0AAJ0MJK3_9PEZI|nr:muts domain V-domain-containing protein [Lasiosphaeria hispida]